MITKQSAMGTVSNLLKDERTPHHMETTMGADGILTLIGKTDCIHLTWFLDNALRELQLTCTFREKWLDILGFPDINGGPIAMGSGAKTEVIKLLNRVNNLAKFGCAFYLDTDTSDVACAGRIPYALLERMPEYVIDMIVAIWEFFTDIGDELMDVAEGQLKAEDAFQMILDKGWDQ